MDPVEASRNTPSPQLLGVAKLNLKPLGGSPVMSKRRRMNDDTLSSQGSPCGSPVCGISLMAELAAAGYMDPNRTFEDLSDSNVSISPTDSPTPFRHGGDKKGKYRKDELWRAIRSDYQFLMDEEIIDTCKSTESDLSWESDDLATNTKVSFTEFMQQYKELSEWLHHIHVVTRRQSSSLSEKYLNQTYHEEMLQRSPRRKLFNDYAKQLMRRYPSMKEEILRRLQHLNGQWAALEKMVSPRDGSQDPQNMVQDLESDLNCLRQWLHETEGKLLPLSIKPSWTMEQVKTKLAEHQELQTDIESHSKIVSAVLKLSEHLESSTFTGASPRETESLKLQAVNLERRWHTIWLQSLEWQCRLEEALAGGKGLNRRDNWSSFSFPCTKPFDLSNISEGEQSDGVGELEFGFENSDSDESNLDVIPFAESEYEKIVVDVDVQTENNVKSCGKLSPVSLSGKSNGSEECDMDTGTDSALGRSVSDPSVHSEGQITSSVPHSAIIITAERGNKAAGKVVSFAETKEEKMRASSGSPMMGSTACISGKKVTKSESHDIGYSSESHSNDDEIAIEQAPCGTCPTKPQTFGVDEVVLRRKPAESSSNGNDQSPLSADHNKSWRHSMTSAYDTSSNCSEPNSPLDLEASLDTTLDSVTTAIDLGEEHFAGEEDDENTQAIINTCANSNHSYYCMTQVETDTESLGGSLKSSSSIQHYIESLQASASLGSDSGSGDVGNQSEQHLPDTDDSYNWTQPITGFTKYSSSARTDSLIAQLDSDTSGRDNALSASDLSICLPKEESPKKTSMNKLIYQAELMVKEGDHANVNASFRKKRPSCHKARRGIVSSGGSALPTEESQVSSCDASSECTSSGSDSDADYSTASGDDSDDNNYSCLLASRKYRKHGDHSVLCDLSLVGKNKSNSPLKRHRYRPNSVTELYEMSNRLDMSPFSISESAINTLSQESKKFGFCNKLRRTISESGSFSVKRQGTPKRHQRRKMKRAASDDADKTLCSSDLSAEKVMHSTPYGLSPASQSRGSGSREGSGSSDSVPQWFSSRALFSDTLPECETARKAASDSEQDAEKLFATQYDSDVSDSMVKSMNSTLESFSENAWDNYQDPPYASMSDDVVEEKLHWERNLEFEDDFNVEAELNTQKLLERNRTKRKSKGSRGDDSDSDIEDLHHVIEESRQQLAVAEATLKKHRKDIMDVGIYLDPSKYAELVATCQTNIRCLEVIKDTLGNEDALPNVTDEDIDKVTDIIKQWVALEGMACERQAQACDLSAIYKDMVSLKKSMSDATLDLNINCFDDVSDLERNIKALQENKLVLCQQRLQLAGLEDAVRDFSLKHPRVHMSTFQKELGSLQAMLDSLVDRSNSRVSELQSVMISWYDFNETRQELAYLLGQERAQLQVLALAQDLVALSPKDLSDTIQDLKAMEADFEFHSDKLKSVRTLSSDILNVSDETAQVALVSRVASIETELSTVRRSCHQLLTVLEDKAAKQEAGAETTATQTELEYVKQCVSECLGTDDDKSRPKSPSGRSMSPIMRAALPLSVLMVVAVGLACLVNPADLGKMGIVFSPQLKYVRGPPPV